MSWTLNVGKGVPAIRSTFAVESFLTLQEHDDWDALRTAMDPAAVELLHQAPRSGWLPLAFDADICRASAAVLDDAALRAMGHRNAERTSLTPLLAPIVSSASRLLQLAPKTGMRFMQKGVAMLYRDAGTLEFVDEGQPRRALLVWRGLPDMVCDRGFLEIIAGGMEYYFPLLHVEGAVQAHLHGNDATFEFTWS